MLETVKHIPTKEEFHREKFFFSYSSLVKLLNNPKQFYNDYILKEREDSDEKYLKEGLLLHCFVLEPFMFDEKFAVMSGKVPGGGLKDIIDNIYSIHALPQILESKTVQLEDFPSTILKELEKANLYQTFTDSNRADKNGNILTGDQKRLEKCIEIGFNDLNDEIYTEQLKVLINRKECNTALEGAATGILIGLNVINSDEGIKRAKSYLYASGEELFEAASFLKER